jgi:hypothetical protein
VPNAGFLGNNGKLKRFRGLAMGAGGKFFMRRAKNVAFDFDVDFVWRL